MLLVVAKDDNLERASHHRKVQNAHIEVLEVSKRDGEKLIRYLEEMEKKPEAEREPVELFFRLEPKNNGLTNLKENEVDLQFFYSAGDSTGGSYDLIETFSSIHNKLGFLMKYDFYHMIYRCEPCMKDPQKNSREVKENCIMNGKYCDPEPVGSKHRGKLIMEENLRQKCLFINTKAEFFWNYMINYGKKCIIKDDKELDSCVDEVYTLIGIPNSDQQKVEDCIKESYNNEKNVNDLLEEDLKTQKKIGVSHYPSLYVNGNRYEGNLKNQRSVFEFVCKHFTNMPIACKDAIKTPTTTQSTGVTILIIIGTILAMLVMVWCVRRMVKRKIMAEMKDEISNTIAQYTQFKDRSDA